MSQIKRAIEDSANQINALINEMERYVRLAEQVDEVELIKRRMEVITTRSHELTEMAHEQTALFRAITGARDGGA